MFAAQLPSPERFSPTRLAISALFHGAAILLALTFHFAAPITPTSAKTAHVTLLAPPRITPPAPPKVRPRVAVIPIPTLRSELRAFTAPRPIATAQPRTAPIEIALPEQLPTTAPAVDPLRTTTALPPPPVIVGKLSTASAAPSSSGPATSVRTTGFSGTPDAAAVPAPARTTRAAGFGEASTAAPATPKTAAAIQATAVEILSKPRPLYSDEARQLRIEGEVLLEVLFTASGEARVTRTIRGLGHGLDEAAVASAKQIKFRPAQRAGQPVDQTATVHISFQLAY